MFYVEFLLYRNVCFVLLRNKINYEIEDADSSKLYGRKKQTA